jgi:sulfur-carrier protein
MKINLLYFGRPREILAASSETVEAPDSIATLGELLDWLRQRGENWTHELADNRVRCALNQEMCAATARIKAGDEVAIFSPISGG